MTLEQLKITRDFVIEVEVKEDWRRRYPAPDIGVFDENHAQTHGREIIKRGLLSVVSSQDVNTLISKLHGNYNARFSLIPSLQTLTQENLKTLRTFADYKFERAQLEGSPEIDDLKINLTRTELIAQIGSAAVQEIE